MTPTPRQQVRGMTDLLPATIEVPNGSLPLVHTHKELDMKHSIDAQMAFHLIPFSHPCLAIQNCFHSTGFEKGALFVQIYVPNTPPSRLEAP